MLLKGNIRRLLFIFLIEIRGLKRNIFTLNIHYSQPIFREYSLFFAYFKTNIHYSLKKVDVPGYTIFRSTKREGPDKLYCSKDKISYKVQTCRKRVYFHIIITRRANKSKLDAPSRNT